MTLSSRDPRSLPVALVKAAIDAEARTSALLRLANRTGAGSVTWTDETVSFDAASSLTALLIAEAEKRGATLTLARIIPSPDFPGRFHLLVEADTPR